MHKIWLMKSEPDVYSIETLKKDKTTWWEGVRNYQARNFMKEMEIGDIVLFYHSSTEPPGIAGLAKVKKAAEADKSQFDKKSEYYDPKSSREKPIWFCVQVEYTESFTELISLDQLRQQKSLQSMLVLKKGQRLSVQPVLQKEFDQVLKMKAGK